MFCLLIKYYFLLRTAELVGLFLKFILFIQNLCLQFPLVFLDLSRVQSSPIQIEQNNFFTSIMQFFPPTPSPQLLLKAELSPQGCEQGSTMMPWAACGKGQHKERGHYLKQGLIVAE